MALDRTCQSSIVTNVPMMNCPSVFAGRSRSPTGAFGLLTLKPAMPENRCRPQAAPTLVTHNVTKSYAIWRPGKPDKNDTHLGQRNREEPRRAGPPRQSIPCLRTESVTAQRVVGSESDSPVILPCTTRAAVLTCALVFGWATREHFFRDSTMTFSILKPYRVRQMPFRRDGRGSIRGGCPGRAKKPALTAMRHVYPQYRTKPSCTARSSRLAANRSPDSTELRIDCPTLWNPRIAATSLINASCGRLICLLRT